MVPFLGLDDGGTADAAAPAAFRPGGPDVSAGSDRHYGDPQYRATLATEGRGNGGTSANSNQRVAGMGGLTPAHQAVHAYAGAASLNLVTQPTPQAGYASASRPVSMWPTAADSIYRDGSAPGLRLPELY